MVSDITQEEKTDRQVLEEVYKTQQRTQDILLELLGQLNKVVAEIGPVIEQLESHPMLKMFLGKKKVKDNGNG